MFFLRLTLYYASFPLQGRKGPAGAALPVLDTELIHKLFRITREGGTMDDLRPEEKELGTHRPSLPFGSPILFPSPADCQFQDAIS
jgi:hypothetical protein